MWTMIDTFSGIGGFSLAAEWTGRIRPVQFIEIDPFCRRVLAKHWPGVPIHDDIRTFLADAEQRQGGERHNADPIRGWACEAEQAGMGGIDLLTGGFPCQPFSAAGKQRGANDDRYLWPEIARLVAALRPRWCLFENVAGIVNMAGGLQRVCADLEGEGYEVGWVLIPAAAVGAPHKRERVWIIAHASESDADRERKPQSRWPIEEFGGWPEHVRQESPHAIKQRLEGVIESWPATGPTLGGGRREQAQPGLGHAPDGISRWLDERFATGPLGDFGPGWEDGCPRVCGSVPDRVNKLKALGNAIVPQVAYVIMQAMLEADQ